jgi:anaerobic ribonucleoside-triphosphate reductase
MPPQFVIKRDGKKARFDESRIKKAIGKAAGNVYDHAEAARLAEDLFADVSLAMQSRFNGKPPRIEEVEQVIFDVAKQKGPEFSLVANAYQTYSRKRAEARTVLEVMSLDSKSSTTDTALLIESDSKYTISGWNRDKVAEQLEREANLAPELARDVSKQVENTIIDFYQRGIRHLKTTDVRAITDLILRKEGLEFERRQQELLGIPMKDLEGLIFSKNKENSNVASNNPEAVNLGIAEIILKQLALSGIFSEEVSQAHLSADLHLHDLGYIDRVYCSAHSMEFIKKYGLNKTLTNLESKSDSPGSAAVLNQHVQTFLASKQSDYAGALGFGFVNIFYSSLLNRPVKVVHGRINGSETSIEKKDLEKLLEQGVFTQKPEDRSKPYFEKMGERMEMREVGQDEYDQTAQNLIFAASQNAFSRGGQTLFIDFNIHTGVPSYMKNVPAIGPKGKYIVEMPDGHVEMVTSVPRFNGEKADDSRNGDADSSQLTGELAGGKIITYGMLEPATQRFAKSLLTMWRRGDKDGRPFHFPKCDLHVDANSFEDPKQQEIIDLACQVASENGSPYFMFDRGSDAVLAQCCRLKEKVEDKSMLKYPEKLRFVGFQNVTINLPRQAYKGKTLEGTLQEVDKVMDLALQAHLQKKEYIQKLLDTDGSPLRGPGKPSDDGKPYIELDKATYIIGTIGLNETVQVLTGKQLHESEEAYKMGLAIVAHMYRRTKEFKEKTGLKFTLEESPAESTTRRFAKVDRKDKEFGESAKEVMKGTEDNPYYTNSIHFAPDAPVSLIDRIVGQSKFHDLIASGAIIHAYIGERRPEASSIRQVVKQTLETTSCSQLVFSPTYTECDECGTVMPGEKELCETSDCKNHDEKTVDSNTISPVTRIVGYYSRIKHWNGSQAQIFEDRKSTAAQYAGEAGQDMDWIYNPNGHKNLKVIQFAKHHCLNCDQTKERVSRKIGAMGLDGKVDFEVHYLDDPSDEVGLAMAAMYNVPFDVFPSVVVAGKDNYWKKTTKYATVTAPDTCKTGACDVSERKPAARTDFIRPEEVEREVISRLAGYGITYTASS